MIVIRDKNFIPTMVIDDEVSIVWVERYFEAGSCEIEVPIHHSKPELRVGQFLTAPDYPGCMVIDDVRLILDGGVGMVRIFGTSATILMDWRRTNGLRIESGTASSVIYAAIDEHILNPTNPKRRMSLGRTNDIFDDAIEMVRDGETVYDFVQAVCKHVGLGIECVYVEPGTLYFRLYRGIDRTPGSGNAVVIFSETFDNVLDGSYATTAKDYKNVVTIATEDDLPQLQEFDIFPGDEPEGLYRRELYLDLAYISRNVDGTVMTDEEYATVLVEEGFYELSIREPRGIFEMQVSPDGVFQYGRDFGMGDIVRCSLYSYDASGRIVEVTRSNSSEGPKTHISVDFNI